MGGMYKVGVVGAGNMGSGVAQKMAQEGLDVKLVDIADEFLQKGLDNIKQTLQQGVERKIFTEEQVKDILSRVTGSTSLEDLADRDLVLEAVFENEKVKGEVFSSLDGICSPDTVLATNTSSFRVMDLAAYTSYQDRVIGMHYFYHPAMNRLLEIVCHEGTSEETLQKALMISKLHGKTAIVVKDSPGFAVNRFFIPWYVEAIRILEEGAANIPTIEEAAKNAFKIGMGPFELINVTGVPIAYHSAVVLGKEIGPFYDAPELLRKQFDSKQNWDLSGEVEKDKFQLITDRLYATAIGVAADLVEEEVATIEDTDRGAKLGLRWRLGPFELANRIGIDEAYRIVGDMSERHPDFKVSALLERQKGKGEPFTFKYVDLEVKDNIAYITINRPEAMNALNPSVVDQLAMEFERAENDPTVKGIVLQAAGKEFVAGADIGFFVKNIKNDNFKAIYEFTRLGHELLKKIEESPKTTVALLDGLSLGGGSELALACQAIVATPGGMLGFPETGIGIYPGLGGMYRLSRHVGPELAKYYVFTGKTLRARDAFELGIINRLVELPEVEGAVKELVAEGVPQKYRSREIPAAFEHFKAAFSADNLDKMLKGEPLQGVDQEFASKTARMISKKAPLALKMANELIDAQVGVETDQAIEMELGKLQEIFSTEDALAGLQAPPGRPPEYQGR